MPYTLDLYVTTMLTEEDLMEVTAEMNAYGIEVLARNDANPYECLWTLSSDSYNDMVDYIKKVYCAGLDLDDAVFYAIEYCRMIQTENTTEEV